MTGGIYAEMDHGDGIFLDSYALWPISATNKSLVYIASVGLWGIRIDEKQEFANSAGEVVVPLIYEAISQFSSDGLAAVRLDGKWGFIAVASSALQPPPPPEPLAVEPTAATVIVDGAATAFEAYNINGNNYFKLRDLAFALSGSGKQFSVAWDGEANAITLTSGGAYEPAGGEMALGDGTAKEASPTTARVFLDGRELSLTAYNIGGNNFFRLRDLMSALDIGVTWDGETSTIGIDTSISYTEG